MIDLLRYPADPQSIPRYLQTNFDRIKEELEQASTPDHVHEDTEWISLAGSYINSWVDFDTDRAGRYRKINGIVYLNGTIKSGIIGSTAFTLPVGYRIDNAGNNWVHLPAVSNDAFGAALVHPDGRVIPFVGNNTYFDISLISYIAA